jgi:hypothetical protein
MLLLVRLGLAMWLAVRLVWLLAPPVVLLVLLQVLLNTLPSIELI